MTEMSSRENNAEERILTEAADQLGVIKGA